MYSFPINGRDEEVLSLLWLQMFLLNLTLWEGGEIILVLPEKDALHMLRETFPSVSHFVWGGVLGAVRKRHFRGRAEHV